MSGRPIKRTLRGEHDSFHTRDSVGHTIGGTQRCLRPAFSERIGNSRRTATAGEPGRRRSAAGASGRIAQFLPPGGRMRGRPIKRTLRDDRVAHRNILATTPRITKLDNLNGLRAE